MFNKLVTAPATLVSSEVDYDAPNELGSPPAVSHTQAPTTGERDVPNVPETGTRTGFVYYGCAG